MQTPEKVIHRIATPAAVTSHLPLRKQNQDLLEKRSTETSELRQQIRELKVALEQATQERYIADLASDVAQLKNRQLQANKALKDDSRTLDATDRGLDQNLAQLETNRSRLGKQLQTMRSSKCWTFLMVAIVIALFVFTYLFIKLFPKPRRR